MTLQTVCHAQRGWACRLGVVSLGVAVTMIMAGCVAVPSARDMASGEASAISSSSASAPPWAWARQPLTSLPGRALVGQTIVANRQQGLCVLCHQGPFGSTHLLGNLGPDLAGVGRRLGESELRARMIDSNRVTPGSVMPAYHRTDGLQQLPAALRNKPLLDAQQIEDVVAYLRTL